MVMAIAPEVTPASKFGLVSGCISAVFASASILGPIIGGAITSTTTWRWVFYLKSAHRSSISRPKSSFADTLRLVAFPVVLWSEDCSSGNSPNTAKHRREVPADLLKSTGPG